MRTIIKLLFVTDKLIVGGLEKVLINIISNLNSKEFDITLLLLCPGGELEHKIPNHIKIKYIFKEDPNNFSKFKYNFINYCVLLMPGFISNYLFLDDKYDICVTFKAALLYYVKGIKCKKICWIHDYYFPFGTRNNIQGNIRKYLTLKYLKRQQKIICVSQPLKQELITYSNNSLKNIFVKYNPLNTDLILEKGVEKVTDISYNSKFKLVSVGRLDKIKGYERLIKICSSLRDKGYNFSLWIIGDGDQRASLEMLIKKENLSENVYLLGMKENPYKYINKSDILICSSYSEGYSTVLCEGIVLEKAIVSTNCGGPFEILDNGKFGILTDNSADDLCRGIESLFKNESLIDKLKEKSKERSLIFNLKENINQLEKMFINCLNE